MFFLCGDELIKLTTNKCMHQHLLRKSPKFKDKHSGKLVKKGKKIYIFIKKHFRGQHIVCFLSMPLNLISVAYSIQFCNHIWLVVHTGCVCAFLLWFFCSCWSTIYVSVVAIALCLVQRLPLWALSFLVKKILVFILGSGSMIKYFLTLYFSTFWNRVY